MLLRESGEREGNEVDLEALTRDGSGGVAHGVALSAFAEAVLSGDAVAVARAREGVRATLGDAAIVDAAAVIAAFQKLDRLADATGVPLDAPMEIATRRLRGDLGLDRLVGAANTSPPRGLRRIAARFATPFLLSGMKLASRLLRRVDSFR